MAIELMFLEHRFPLEAVQGPDASEDDAPPAAALRELISRAEVDLPKHGWRHFFVDEKVAIFRAGRLEDGMEIIRFELLNGRWTPAGGDRLVKRLEIAPPPGLVRAQWWLDPKAGDQSKTRRLRVLATDPRCASGRPTGERLVPPEVVEEVDKVTISFAARPLTGSQTCPKHPPTPYIVALQEPLGTRHLIDGGIGRYASHAELATPSDASRSASFGRKHAFGNLGSCARQRMLRGARCALG